MKKTESALRTDIKKVGIVGCGVMGSGYTQLCAQNSYQVVVCDVSDEFLNRGLNWIKARLAQGEGVPQGPLSEQQKDVILKRIMGTTNFQDLSDCDLVIETATEKMEAKKEIFAELDRICPEDIVLGTNTSVLSVIDIAMVTSRPEQVVGIHMNPLYFPLVELVKTLVTSEEALEVAKDFSRSVGKGIVVAKDTPGFIVNRLFIPFALDAIRMVEEGIASKEDIDALFSQGLGLPTGPLALLDMVGLDTLMLASNALYDDLKDPQCAPPVLLKKMVTAGWLGCKSGKGFYEYEQS